MKLEIVLQGESSEVELGNGNYTVGGSAGDGLRVPGLCAAQYEIRIEGERLMICSPEPFPVDDLLSPGGGPRLILPDERIGLAEGVTLRVLASRAQADRPQTAVVLKDLLGGLAEPEDAACAALTCLTGLDVGRRFAVAGDEVVLGRGDTVDLRIRDRAVSRRHARVRRTVNGDYVIEDLGAPNGLYVNGKRARGATALPDGAIIEMGHSLLRFRAPPKDPEPVPPSPEPITDGGDEMDSLPAAGEPGAASGAEAEANPAASGASGSSSSAAAVARGPAQAASTTPASAFKLEHALVAVGVTLAVLGALVTWNVVAG